MTTYKKDWKDFRRKEWHDFFVEMTLASWGFGIYISPTGHKHLYDIQIGPFTIGYEYKTKAYRRACKLATKYRKEVEKRE